MTVREGTTSSKGKAFRDALISVNLAAVPVMTTDRSITRKEQAALLRVLLKSLGLKGVSVTVPKYSMAQGVDIELPMASGYEAHRERFEQLLAIAFPNHDDRSDYQTDYFDYCWAIS